MITQAYVMRGIGDALNSRDFLLNYCEQKHKNQDSITVYTSIHKNIFKDTRFKIENATKCDITKLTYYANFGYFDLPKWYSDKRFDKCIAVNANINYTFNKIKKLNWNCNISDIDLPEKFVTVNYGHDNNSNPMMKCIKMWSLDYWNKLVYLLFELGIDCVQIGGGWSCKDIRGVKVNLVNKLFLEQSAMIMKKALFHIDVEGGLVILAQHLGVKSVVLFGATDNRHFGRKGNLNLRNSNCNACSGNIDKGSLSKPLYVWDNNCNSRCMLDLKPEYVLEKIKENNWL